MKKLIDFAVSVGHRTGKPGELWTEKVQTTLDRAISMYRAKTHNAISARSVDADKRTLTLVGDEIPAVQAALQRVAPEGTVWNPAIVRGKGGMETCEVFYLNAVPVVSSLEIELP